MYGMKMDRKSLKELGRMEKKMDYGLIGIKMDRSLLKKLTKMGYL